MCESIDKGSSRLLLSIWGHWMSENAFTEMEWLNEDFRGSWVDLSGNESIRGAIHCIHKRRDECLN